MTMAANANTVDESSLNVDQLRPFWRDARAGYAVSAGTEGRWLRPTSDPGVRRGWADRGRPIEIPDRMAVNTGILIPLVAEALRAWDLLGLEIGSAAAVTPGQPWQGLLTLVAGWYGAVPVLPGEAGGPAAIADLSDPDASSHLRRALSSFPAVAAVDLSGRADVVDILLEAIPRSARVLFAGPRHERLTIDYYVNVHRKGLLLASTVLSPLRAFEDDATTSALVGRACRLLGNPGRAAACTAAVVRARSAVE